MTLFESSNCQIWTFYGFETGNPGLRGVKKFFFCFRPSEQCFDVRGVDPHAIRWLNQIIFSFEFSMFLKRHKHLEAHISKYISRKTNKRSSFLRTLYFDPFFYQTFGYIFQMYWSQFDLWFFCTSLFSVVPT